jgi:hypothetical protein
MLGGQSLSEAAPVAITGALAAMGLDSAHGTVKEPDSTAKAAASIKIEIPDAKP